jgi:hypothetical protein
MFIRAMGNGYLGRFGIDTSKIEPTPTFMRPWKEMDEDRIDLILTGIPKGSGIERFRKIRKTSKNIYQEGRKSGIRGFHTEPNYRRRVHQQSTVFSTEQEAIIKAF